MIDVEEEVKELYRTDYIPYRDKTVKKDLKLYFPQLNLTVANKKIYSESMKLEESLCSDSELVFGGCEAAKFEITAAGVTEELIGKEMIVTQLLEDTYEMPLGTYIVDSVVKKDDLIFKDITAYDNMLLADVDVSGWYNSLTFPMKLKEFRLSLCKQLQFDTVEQVLPNDEVSIEKSVEPAYLSGRDVLRAIGEINATFGHFTRDNKFKYIGIGAIGLYPSETLYPEENLFPSECTEYMGSASYKSIKYEDYMVEAIDSVQIRQEEGEVGGIAGKTTNNPYIVQGNFLTFGIDADTLVTMANNILLYVRNKRYRPHNTQIIGLPYLEVGDTVGIATSNNMIESFIFRRTLSGIQSLTDEISAEGSQTRKNEISRSTEIEQLKGKTLKITKSVDALNVEMSDLENETNSKLEQTTEHFTTEITDLKKDTNSKFEQTAEHFTTEISRAEGSLTSKIEQTATEIRSEVTNVESSINSVIEQMAGQIALRVTQGDMESVIRIAINGIYLAASQISLEGYISLNNGFTIAKDGSIVINRGSININTENEKASTIKLNYGNGSLDLYSNMIHIKDVINNNSCNALIGAEFISINKVNTNEITGLKTSSNGNPFLNGSAVATTSWVLENFAKSGLTYSTAQIMWSDNGNGNVSFMGGVAASTSWVLSNFERKASDERLKNIIGEVGDISDIYLSLNPLEWIPREKTTYRKKIHTTLTAQGVMKVFEANGLDWRQYDIIEEKSVKDTDFCGDITDYITDGDTYYIINDKNLHAYHISFAQSMYYELEKKEKRITSLENKLNNLEKMLREKGVI